jgi:hypothetical protein
MSDLRTAAQQALEAWDTYENGTMDHPLSGVMEALRAALEQPDPTNQCGETCERAKLCAICAREIEQEQHDTDCHAQGVCQRSGYSIGAQKQEQEQEQEMVVFSVTKTGALLEWEPTGSAFALPDGKHSLYTSPPAREPLTEDEIRLAFYAAREDKMKGCGDGSKHRLSVVEIARAIERAHGIKGGNDE